MNDVITHHAFGTNIDIQMVSPFDLISYRVRKYKNMYHPGVKNMNVDNNLGDIFRSIRLQKKLTQAELQRLSGVTQSTISDIEEGKRSPQLNTLEKLCDAMGIPVVELLSTKEKFLSSDRLVLKEELEMLKLFRSLSPDQRLRLITFIQSFLVE